MCPARDQISGTVCILYMYMHIHTCIHAYIYIYIVKLKLLCVRFTFYMPTRGSDNGLSLCITNESTTQHICLINHTGIPLVCESECISAAFTASPEKLMFDQDAARQSSQFCIRTIDAIFPRILCITGALQLGSSHTSVTNVSLQKTANNGMSSTQNA